MEEEQARKVRSGVLGQWVVSRESLMPWLGIPGCATTLSLGRCGNRCRLALLTCLLAELVVSEAPPRLASNAPFVTQYYGFGCTGSRGGGSQGA